MAIAKFTIEMAADLGQLRRDINNINQVVSQMGGQIAKAYTPGMAALDQLGAAHTAVANKAALSSMVQQKSARAVQQQNIQLSNQVQDFAIQVAGGQNPLLAFAQQGSQLTAVYGGVRPALAAVTALLTPMTLAVTAGAAAVLGLGIAFVGGSNQSAEFRRSLELTGNAAGVTAEGFEYLIQSVGKNANVGTGAIREMGQALISSGRFGSRGLDELTATAIKMASATGQSVQEVTAQLISLADAPAAYAAKQNKVWHFMTDAQLRNIEVLEANGKREEAVFAVRQALGDKFKDKTAENFGFIERTLHEHSKFWDSFWDYVYGIGRDKTDVEIRERLQRTIETQRKALPKINPDSVAYTEAVKANQASLAELAKYEAKKTAAEAEVADKAKAAAAEQLATEKRTLADRLKGAQESVASAASELKSKKDLAAIDLNILGLQKEQARDASQNPALEAYYKEALAKQELLKLDTQRNALQRDLGRVKGGDKPEDGLAAQQKRLQIQGRLVDLDTQRSKVATQLQIDLGALGQKQAAIDAAALDAKEAARNSLGGYYTQLAQTRVELELQAKEIGLSAFEQNKLATARALSARASQIEIEWSEKARQAGLSELEIEEGLLAIRAEESRALQAYGVIHADEFDRMYTAQRGAIDGIKEYMDSTTKAGENAKQAVGNVTRSMEDALTSFISTGKLDVKGFIDTLIAEFARLAIVKPMMNSLMGGSGGGAGLSGILASLFGGGNGTQQTVEQGAQALPAIFNQYLAAANGAVFSGTSHTQAFANGGAFTNQVVTHPKRFAFSGGAALGLMGEAGAEAVMPLQRDSRGRLGVVAAVSNGGGGGGGGAVTVNVTTQGGQTADVKRRQDANGNTTIDVILRQVQDGLADNVAAGSGSLYNAIGSRFSARGAM